MKSHFLPTQSVAATCAIASALSMLPGNAGAQSLIAADYATNSTYGSGWSAGQNGGYGFGPWSFDGTAATPAGQYQGISTASALGTSWTLLTHDNHAGLADVGRAITEPGGLQPGQTLEMVIQNPLGYHFFRGWDIMCMNATNNNGASTNTAALRTQLFAYFGTTWDIVDNAGDNDSGIDLTTTGSAGMKFDMTLISTNKYSVTLTPLSNPSAAYTNIGTLTTNVPINWINFRLYWGTSSGINDTANNLEVSSMTISGPTLNIQKSGSNVVLSWMGVLTNFALMSSSSLGPNAVWAPVSPTPSLVNGQNVVTNSTLNPAQQFYRLQLNQ